MSDSASKEWDGMLSPRPCAVCGTPLNADGDHPAELYAGTFTGLCYGCERMPRVEIERWPDGAVEWSYPPACPSFRRDREKHIAYPDCPECKGDGFTWKPTAAGFSQYRSYCAPCLERWSKKWGSS